MENRSHALLAGVFTLVFLTVAVLGAIWVGRDRTPLVSYELISATAVSGLALQSAVRYQGVPVGRVQGLALDPDRPGRVRVRIGVAPGTPITESTWAELSVQGVTGSARVDLLDNGSSDVRLVSTDTQLAQIPLRPSFFDRLEQRGAVLLNGIEQTVAQVQRMLSDQNIDALSASLGNAAALTATLKDASRQLGPALAKVGPLTESLSVASAQASRAADEVAALARDTRQVVTHAGNDTLPALTNMADSIGTAARGVSTSVRRIGEAPQSFIFGPPPVRPGPGETGFAGFGGNRD